MIKFRQKDFSLLSSTLTGASLGASLGAASLPTIFKGKPTGKDNNGNNIYGNQLKAWKAAGIGLIVGAALGALVGSIKEISKNTNRKATVDKRLMEKVLMDLKAKGHREGRDYVRDPKKANEMKTRVCVVISKYSDELRILINTAKDPKLTQFTTNLVKNIPNTSNVVMRASDKYNDIIISTISDGSADAGLISGIIDKFIHSGYPVYLVEVG